MFRHYLIVALRNLTRHKLYAAINIVGLTIGLAAALLVVLYVQHETTFERFLPDYERIYEISTRVRPPQSAEMRMDTTPVEVAPWLRSRLPSLTPLARIDSGGTHGLRVGDVNASENVYFADPEFFDVFRLPLVAGDLQRALRRPDGVVLTRSRARNYFGHDDPIGQVLRLDGRYPLVVAAVIEDLPTNTHLDFDIVASSLAPFSTFTQLDAQPLATPGKPWLAHTYFRLPPSIKLAQVRAQAAAFGPEFYRRSIKGGLVLTLPIVPIASIHLSPPGMAAMRSRGSSALIHAVAAVGALILLVAAINFTNLSTARAAARSVEVGVRKAAGAWRTDLVVQFLGESVAVAALAGVVAIALVELLLPAFNHLSQSGLTLDLRRDPQILAVAGGLVLLLGSCAGVYPAVVLSGLRPLNTLKRDQARTSGLVRQVLVTAQFAFLIALMISLGVIYEQVDLAKRMFARLDTTEVFAISGGCKLPNAAELFRAVPGVLAASCSASAPLGFITMRTTGTVRAGLVTTYTDEIVDVGFFELYGIRPIAGRLFARERGMDTGSGDAQHSKMDSVIINATAVRRFGFASPRAALGQVVTIHGSQPSQIIGVVEDFPAQSIRAPIDATVFRVDLSMFDLLSVKLSTGTKERTLAAIDALWRKLDSSRPIDRQPIDQGLRRMYADIVSEGRVFAACSAVALLLAGMGLFGLSSFIAERRTKEVGIRKATGAGRADILRLLIWDLSKPVLWANLLAWPACYFLLRRWLNGFAYHIDLSFPIFLGASAVAMLIAWLVVLGHTARVANANPVLALRYE
jgi:putative ABC transport system permease protein